jgi:hypothetical protein
MTWTGNYRRLARAGDRSDGRTSVFFLHVTTGSDNTNNVLALAFGVMVVSSPSLGRHGS